MLKANIITMSLVTPNMPRRFRRRRSMGSITQSFKKVLNGAPTSRAAGAKIQFILVEGVDSTAAGQTTPTDAKVPTGSIVKYIEIQYAWSNLVSISEFHHWTLQLAYSNQSFIAANVVGGDNQRNQVYHQNMRILGKDQNGNLTLKWKIPKPIQRVREGQFLALVYEGSAVYTDAIQAIYKFYRQLKKTNNPFFIYSSPVLNGGDKLYERKNNPDINRADGESLNDYLSRISEHYSKLEWQSEGHRMWYTHKNPYSRWTNKLVSVLISDSRLFVIELLAQSWVDSS